MGHPVPRHHRIDCTRATAMKCAGAPFPQRHRFIEIAGRIDFLPVQYGPSRSPPRNRIAYVKDSAKIKTNLDDAIFTYPMSFH